jgi:hypothetical protein
LAGDSDLPQLRVTNSRHYEIHTDLQPDFADDLARRMDAMFEEYGRRLNDFQPPGDAPKLAAYLFIKHDDYTRLTHTEHSGGIFMVSGRRGSFLAGHLEHEGRDGLRRVLQHEGCHQFTYSAIGPNIPVWLNEGIAELFEDAIWMGDGFRLGEVAPRRVRQLQADIRARTLVDFKSFMQMSHEQWNQDVTAKAELAATYYTQAWAMAQYLSEARPDYRKRLMQFLKDLRAGNDPDASWKAAFDDLTALQKEFTAWALGLKATQNATMIERQEVLGDMLAGLKGRGKTFANVAQFRNYVVAHRMTISYKTGKLRWTSAADPRLYFCDSDGKLLGEKDLYFDPSDGAPLPDIVCRASDARRLRTHFYEGDGKIEHEVRFDSTGR